jgi:hypothetical protein
VDNETFEALTEALALECSQDHAKFAVFAKIFFGDYKNRSASFLNLDAALGHGSNVSLFCQGKLTEAHVTSCEWTQDRDTTYGFSGQGSHYAPMSYRVRLEISATF